MQRDDIKEFLFKSTVIKIEDPGDEKSQGYEASLPNGDILQIYFFEECIMLFVQVEVLHDIGQEHPEVFEGLLAANNLGGRFYNERLTYDADSTAVHICHDVFFGDIDCQQDLDEELERFVNNYPVFAAFVRGAVISPILDVLEQEE